MAAQEVVGQIDVDPPLDEEGRDAFALITRPGGYDAPGRPRAACGWVPCRDGCCLRLVDPGDSEDAAAWLRYAVTVLGKEEGRRLGGLVVASGPDGSIYSLRVTPQQRVFCRVLREGTGIAAHRPPTPVAGVIDLAERRQSRR